MAKFFNKFLNVIGLEERDDENEETYEDEPYEEQPARSAQQDYRRAQSQYDYEDQPAAAPRAYARDEEQRTARPVRSLDDYRRGRETDAVPPAAPQVSLNKDRGGRPVSNSGFDSHSQTKIYQMSSYDEATAVIDNLLRGVSVLMNLERLETKESQRIIDTISGAAYALQATLKRVAAKTFLVAPSGVDVFGGYADEDDAPPRPAAKPQQNAYNDREFQ